jgi:hypothetical protein
MSGMGNSMTLSGAGPIKPMNEHYSNYSFDKKHGSLSGLSGSTAANPRRNSI